jgi:hypothetical protein
MLTDIEINRHYALLLGWTPLQLGATAFDDHLIQMIRALQADLNVEVDGRCGPRTYRALVERWFKESQQNVGQAADRLLAGGRIAVLEAKRVWLETIVDPPNRSPDFKRARERIDGFIRSKDGLGWRVPPYEQDNDFKWCGAFVANAWRAGGIAFELRRSFFASTLRLDAFGQYRLWQDWAQDERPADNPRLSIRLDEDSAPRDALFSATEPPREGDILLVGGRKTAHGSHICLVESYDVSLGVFTTIEGNATGDAPSGRRIEGVVRTKRPVGLSQGAAPTTYHARRLIRPSIHDLA